MENKYSNTLVDILNQRSVNNPEQIVYSFLGTDTHTSLSYRNLANNSIGIATQLVECAGAETRVILLYPSGLDFISALFACFYAKMIAVPVYSHNLNIEKLLPRLVSVVQDTDARVILTTSAIVQDRQRLIELAPCLRQVTFIATNEINLRHNEDWQHQEIDPRSVAFLQYSSGSTGSPKGVMVTHKNLMSNVKIIQKSFGLVPHQGVVSWLPHYHDMGLIGNILGGMYSQTPLHMFSPIDFVRKPLRWLQLISSTQSVVSGGPNFAYELCNQHIKAHQCEQLDLSCWEVAYNGAEMVRESTLKRFNTLFAPYGFKAKSFHPCYGLAEATLMVASSDKNEIHRELILDRKSLCDGAVKEIELSMAAMVVVSSGRIQEGQKVVIVDPESKLACESRTVGEIWINGPSVCKGYWNKVEATEFTFGARLKGQEDAFLRTGDMGFLDEDGWLYVTGRLKDLIIIRGQNHSPEDIETTVIESHPSINRSRAIAFSLEEGAQEHLAVLITQPKNDVGDGVEILDAIYKQVAEKHDLSIKELRFIKRDSIPLTSSGKIRRAECKRLFNEGQFQFIDVTKKQEPKPILGAISLQNQSTDTRFAIILGSLQKMMSQELAMPLEQINILAPLNLIALDSLSKVRIQHGIQELTGTEIEPALLLSDTNLIGLARIIADEMEVAPTLNANSQAGEQKHYRLSQGQYSLFFMNKLISDSPAYIISRAVTVKSPLVPQALEQAFKNLVKRHVSLRTRFIEQDDKPIQSVLSIEECPINLVFVDASNWSELELKEQLAYQANQCIDLSSGIMARLSVFKTGQEHVLLFSVHHIVSDLSSLTIMVAELCEFYSAAITGQDPSLPSIQVYPSDYVLYEEQLLGSEKAERMRSYWQQELYGHDEPLELPTDKYRPAIKSYKGSTSSFIIPQALTQKMQQFAANKGVTPYVVLVSVYFILLHRYTGKTNVIVGTPMANRMDAKFARLVSYLVNPVPLRADFSQQLSFDDIIEQIKQKTLSASVNQQYPITKIIEDLKIQRDASTTPLFQAMFSYLNPMLENDLVAFALGQPGCQLHYKQLTLEPYPIESTGAQFDLNVGMAVVNESIVSSWEYSTDLFELASIQRMQHHFQFILEQMLSNSQQAIEAFSLLSTAERQQILCDWNATNAAYDLEKPLHVLFEQQVEKTPDALAVLDKNEMLSYAQFNRRVNQLAHHLIDLGVGQGSIVVVQMQRSIEMLVALYAILKAGGAYLPLDPEYPKQHRDWVLVDAQPKVILTQSIPDCADMPVINPKVAVAPEHTAYIIYTSGSTGKPKGVMVPHRGICNRLIWMQETYELSAEDRVLQKTPYTFDVSVWELFWPLMSGASLYISEPNGHKDPYYLASIIQQQQISTIHFVPSMLKPFVDNEQVSACTSLKRIFCSGEALNPDLAQLCLDRLNADLHNLYGPTEASVDVSSWHCPRQQKIERVFIGKPIANMQLYLLDQFMRPVPIGVHGELYIGGVGLAHGYLNRPELTAERFVDNPFSAQSKLYKTGDLCRYQADGTIEYLGRIDNQVKIRGFRIELEEVELALCSHPGISEAVAVAIKDALGNSRLAVYFVAPGSEIPTTSELRAYLGKRLPEHMLPSLYVPLSFLPRLSNGKLDRKSLPKPDSILRTDDHRVYCAPRTPTEQMLCSLYEELLTVDRVGINDNFFDLGGDSIMGLRAVAKIRDSGFEVSIQQLYSNATVAEVAALINKNKPIENKPQELTAFSLVSPEDEKALPDNIEDAYPLSKMQEGLVFHSEFSPDYEIYVMGMHIGLRFDQHCLHKSLSIMTMRHPLLRTAFDHLHYSEPLQLVYPNAQIPVRIIDTQHLSIEDQEHEIERFMREEKWRKFDWSKPPFLRLAIHKRSEHTNQFTFCHPLFDGWSMGLLITEFFTIYGSLLKKQEVLLDPAPNITYRDFVALEQKTIGSDDSLRYWKRLLADTSRGELPRWPAHRKSGPGMHIRLTVKVDSATLSGLQQLAAAAEVPFKSVLLAAHMRVVGMLTGRTDVTTGLLVNGRPEELNADKIIGMFLNTVPFSVHLQGRDWIELVKDTFNSERDMLPHRRFPLAELVRTYGGGKQLFETAFNYIHFHVYKSLEQVPDLSVLGWKSPSDQTYFPLTAYFHLDISQASSELLFFLDVDTGVLDQQQIDNLQHYYLNTLNSMAANFYAPYQQIPLLPDNETHLVIKEWNKTQDPVAEQHPFVHHRFSQQAQLNPNKIALTVAEKHLTYGELEQRSNCLAHFLRSKGVGPNVPVGVCIDRSSDLIVALFGVLKAGGAYVPLDPLYPKNRLAHMLEDSQAPLVLTQDLLTDNLPEGQFQKVFIDSNWPLISEQSDLAPDVALVEQDLAYIIYTSGSTGTPKGVEIPHRALGNFISSIKQTLNWIAEDSLLSVTTISFDIAGLEIYLPLTTGAQVVLASRELTMDAVNLARVLTQSDITTMQATPATWRMLLSSGWTGRAGLRALCGGERMPQDLAQDLLDRGCSLWNMYGPTETTIWSTVWEVKSAEDVIPIGRPIANTYTYVLDEFGQPVPIGVAGELYIGGRGLANGYRNLPELTAERFCVDPFVAEADALMYRTGDLVCFRPDGVLEYLSRLDQQVKVRGFRIELGEVETALNAIEGVDKGVVKIVGDGFGENHIIAYLLQSTEFTYSNAVLRSKLMERLPAYMVPSNFVEMKQFPMTLNGKIDYNALPDPVDMHLEHSGLYSPPESDLQHKIAGIFTEVLRMEKVGIDDNFFDMGGHSLSLVRVHVQLQELLKRKIPIVKLFEHATIRKIAALFETDDEQSITEQASQRAFARRGWLDKQKNRRKITNKIPEPISG
ncbi:MULTISPECIES: non-ribosomal peptide synthetase [Legionella]|uniref:Non-ribosomal peptide synthase n=1 Tax=Legionella drozanskii LLAP-1 TaxID=1212489 RepID=A0A0W0TAP4_9GAMM|nr:MULTISPECIES: non-ribosomal peptide synthetase [Legionella]KTC92608.1 non-ribosomal peptide synthase [Legionella drozanskii LLAP-1]PJE18207.1 MAG: non-ribosomal peptide synthetase [Legionella sp.]